MVDVKQASERVARLSLFPLQDIIALLILFALYIDIDAVLSGLHLFHMNGQPIGPDEYQPFFKVIAWLPFPIFFLVVFFVVRQSWDAFHVAWLTLPETKVLQRVDGQPVEDVTMDAILKQFNRWRVTWLIPLSLVAGFVTMYFDSEREQDTMRAGHYDVEQTIRLDSYFLHKTTLAGQVARACEAPSFMSKWLWEQLAESRIDANVICGNNGKADKDKKVPRVRQFNLRRDKAMELFVTHGVNNDFVKPPASQWRPVLLMHIADGILISFGWLIFLQCVAHPLFFARFERLKVAQHDGKPFLTIKLDSQSAHGEFGLQYWNHALNNLYWFFSLALLIPIMSRFSQPDLQDLDTSQLVLQFAMPILVAIPMVMTILSRQNRLPQCWDTLSEETTMSRYKLQRLWPLDENWSSKMGVVLAFIILSFSFGYSLMGLI